MVHNHLRGHPSVDEDLPDKGDLGDEGKILGVTCLDRIIFTRRTGFRVTPRNRGYMMANNG